MTLGLGKLVGKVAGEIVAAPVTIATELVEAATETVEQAEKAIGRATEEPERPSKR